MAMKATYGVFGGKEVPIYKDPKTDQGGLKKSQKGCCAVIQIDDGNYTCFDGHSDWVPDNRTVLRPVYKDGQLINKMTFQEVRANLYPEEV
jgi:nicotinamide phosphoribosyltransferase